MRASARWKPTTSMGVVFTEESWEDYTYWQATDRKILKRINRLIDDIARADDGGIGKP